MPTDCILCHQQFPTKMSCDQHLKKFHNLKCTSKELNASRFKSLSAEGGLFILENTKEVLCSICSKGFSVYSSGTRHFKSAHMKV